MFLSVYRHNITVSVHHRKIPLWVLVLNTNNPCAFNLLTRNLLTGEALHVFEQKV